jgi:hypothetical protein
MSEKIKVRILQDDCSAYDVLETKNGAQIEIAKDVAERMAQSGHAEIITEKAANTKTK